MPEPTQEVEGAWEVRDGRALPAATGHAPFRAPRTRASRRTSIGNLYGVSQEERPAVSAVAPAFMREGRGDGNDRDDRDDLDDIDASHEALDYSNPFRQELERVWFDGRIVYACELGEIDVDPALLKVAQEYQVVFAVELDEGGKPVREPERVPGQFNIYDSVPGMEQYSPLWQFNFVIVPQDYVPNTLRSEGDCLASGYPIVRSTVIEN